MTGLSRHVPVGSSLGDHVVCDLLDADRTSDVIRRASPDVVIHTQALSDVDRCELEPEQAKAQNVTTTAHLVQALGGRNALFVYISTDYVFDGAGRSPYRESDQPNPLSTYGHTKLEGEQQALALPGGVVVRPSTLFGPGRNNFCDTIVHAAQERRTVEAFADQTTSPTYTEDAAEVIAALIALLGRSPQPERLPRVYHVANAVGCTRAAFAYRVMDFLGCSRDLVRPIRMSDQGRAARRPPYSVLATENFRTIGRTLRPWDDALEAYLRQRHWLT